MSGTRCIWHCSKPFVCLSQKPWRFNSLANRRCTSLLQCYRWTRLPTLRGIIKYELSDTKCRRWAYTIAVYGRTHGPSWLAWSAASRQPLGAALHSSYEPGELSQWLGHDDSTISIVPSIDISNIIYYSCVLRCLMLLCFRANVDL